VSAKIDESLRFEQVLYEELEARLEISFQDKTLLHSALTHPSYANEHPEDPIEDNERLEFLGDSVLSMLVARSLYQRFPDVNEGRLTEWRSHLVCGPTLSKIATQIKLGPALRLGRGEERTGGRDREGNLERAYEALIGALYLDQGLECVNGIIEKTLIPEFELLIQGETMLNPKGELQELVMEKMNIRPEYVLSQKSGPDKNNRHEYVVEVFVSGELLGSGIGSTKQQAEKYAASRALEILSLRFYEKDSC
tara:strand:- start:10338 stop:11093 length:756 start_codon:yes stop_codon:yes gene_type:complete